MTQPKKTSNARVFLRNTMAVPLVDMLLEKHINKYLLVGFGMSGNLLEIMYNLVDEDTANVFHAMKCRKEWYKYLPRSV